uniref:Putative mucin-17 n=1 Tax=Rhipicephalus pulchellus TaxID=72859 RepID=L7LYT9_RHIPC
MSTIDVGTSSEHEKSSEVIGESDQPLSPLPKFQLNLHITNEQSHNNMKSFPELSTHTAETTSAVKNGDTGSVYKLPPLETSLKPLVYVKDGGVSPNTGAYPSDIRLRASTSVSSAITSNNILSSNPTGTGNEPTASRRHEIYKTAIYNSPEHTTLSKKIFESGFTEFNTKYAGQTSKTASSAKTNSYLTGSGLTTITPLSSTKRWPNKPPQVSENIFPKPQSGAEARAHYLNFNSKLLSSSKYQGQYSQGSASQVSKINDEFSSPIGSPANYNKPFRAHFSQEGLSTYARLRSAFNPPNARPHATHKSIFTTTQNEAGTFVHPEKLTTDLSLRSARQDIGAKNLESYLSENKSNLSPPIHLPTEKDADQAMKVVYSESSWPIENTYNALETTRKKGISAHLARQPSTALPHQAPSLTESAPFPGPFSSGINNEALSHQLSRNEKKSHVAVSEPSTALLTPEESFLSNYRAVKDKFNMSMSTNESVLFPTHTFEVNFEHPPHIKSSLGKEKFYHPSGTETLRPNMANTGVQVETTAIPENRHERQRLSTNFTTASLPSQWRRLISESAHLRFEKTSLHENAEGQRTKLLAETKTSSTLQNIPIIGNVATLNRPPTPNWKQSKRGSFKTEPKGNAVSGIAPSLDKVPDFIPTVNTTSKLSKERPAVLAEEISAPRMRVLSTTRTLLMRESKERASRQPPSPNVARTKKASFEEVRKSTAHPSMTPPYLEAPRLGPAVKYLAELPKQQSSLPVKEKVSPTLNVLPARQVFVKKANKAIEVKPPAPNFEQKQSISLEGERKRPTKPQMAPSLVKGKTFISAMEAATEPRNRLYAVSPNEENTPGLSLPPSKPTIPTQAGNVAMKIQLLSPQNEPTKMVPPMGEVKRITKQPMASSLPKMETETPIAKSAEEFKKASSGVHAKEISTPVLNVPASTLRVSLQRSHVEMKAQPPSPKAEPAKNISFKGELKGTTESATAPSSPTIERFTPALTSASELAKTPSATQANKITTPVLNVRPPAPRIPPLGGNVEMKGQLPSPKPAPAKSTSFEGELKRTTKPAAAQSLPTIETMIPGVKSASELPKTPSAVQASKITAEVLNIPPSTPRIPIQAGNVEMKVQPPSPKPAQAKSMSFEGDLKRNTEYSTTAPLPTTATLTPAVKSAPEFPKTPSAVLASERTTKVFNVPPSTPRIPTQAGNLEMKVKPPSPVPGQAKTIPFEGELKGSTKSAMVPSFPTIAALPPGVKPAPKLPKTPPAVQTSEITTKVLNVPPLSLRIPPQAGNVEMKVQPPSLKPGQAKNISFEGELKGTRKSAMAPTFPTIAAFPPGAKPAPKLPKSPLAVEPNEITTPVLNVPPSAPRVPTQGGYVEKKVQPPSRNAGPAKSAPFESELKSTKKAASLPSIPTIETLTPAVKSAPQVPNMPSAVRTNEITASVLNFPPSTPRVRTHGGNREIKVQQSSRKAEPVKNIILKGQLKRTTEAATSPTLLTNETLTPAVKSAPEPPKTPSSVQAIAIIAPSLNMPPLTPRVSLQGGNVEMKEQPPSPKGELGRSISFEGELKGPTIQPIPQSLPTVKSTPIMKSAVKLQKSLSAVHAKEITTPAINIPPSTPWVPTQGINVEMKVQPPSPKPEPAKSMSFQGELKGTIESAMAPSLPTIARLTPAVKSAPHIITPVLNVPPSTLRVPMQGGNVEKKVQPPLRKAGLGTSINFEGELKSTTTPASALSIPTIETLTPAVKSAPELPQKPSAVRANGITTPVFNVPPSTPRVRTQGGNLEIKVQQPSRKAEPVKNIIFKGELNRTTEAAMTPTLPMNEALNPAAKSVPESPKPPSSVQASEISTPVLNVPLSTPRAPTQGGNVEMKVQLSSPKAEAVKNITLEREIKRTIGTAAAPSLRTIETMTAAVKSAPELLKTPSAVQASGVTQRTLNVAPSTSRVPTQGGNVEMKGQLLSPKAEPVKSVPLEAELKGTTESVTARPLSTIKTFTTAGESAPKLPATPFAVQANKTTTPALNVPPSTARTLAQVLNVALKVRSPSPKAERAKSMSFKGKLKATTESATAPSLPTIATLTPAVKSAPELLRTPSVVKGGEITVPILNVQPSTSTLPTRAGSVEIKVQPSSLKAEAAKSITFEGKLNRITEPATAPSLQKIKTLTPGVKSAPKLSNTPPAVHPNEITTPVLNIFPSIPKVPTQEVNVAVKIHTPSPIDKETKSLPTEGELKRTIGPAMAPSFPKVETLLTTAVISRAQLPKTPSGAQAHEIATSILNVPPSKPRVTKKEGNVAIKIHPPSLELQQKKSASFEGRLKAIAKAATAPSLPTIQSVSPTEKSPAELPKTPAVVHVSELTTPVFNARPSTPRVPMEGGNVLLKIHPPTPKLQEKKSVSFQGRFNAIPEAAVAPSLPMIQSVTPAKKSAAQLPKTSSVVNVSELTTPVLNARTSTPRAPTKGGNASLKIHPPIPKLEQKKSASLDGRLKAIAKAAATLSLPAIQPVTSAKKSQAELPKAPAVVHVSEITTPALNARPSTQRVPMEGGNVKLNIRPPTSKLEKNKSVSFEDRVKAIAKAAAAPSLPTIQSVSPTEKSPEELPNNPAVVHVNEITSPVLNVQSSTPRVPLVGGHVRLKLHPPSPTLEQQSLSIDGKLNKQPAVLPNKVFVPGWKLRASAPIVPLQGVNVAMKIQPPSPKIEQPKSATFEGVLKAITKPATATSFRTIHTLTTAEQSVESLPKTPSAVHVSKITTPVLNRPTSAPILLMQGANVAMKIQPPSTKSEQLKSVSFEGTLKTVTKPAIAPSLRTIQRLTPAQKSPAELPETPSTAHTNKITSVFNVPPSTPGVAAQGGNVAVKILPPPPKVEHAKNAPSMGELNSITKQPTTPSHPTIESLTPVVTSAAELPRTSSTVHAEITTPGLNIPPSAPIVPMRAVNLATKILQPSPKTEQPKSVIFEGKLKRTTELATAPPHPTMESSIAGLKSVAELPKTVSAAHAHKISTPVISVPLSTPSATKKGSHIAIQMPPHSRKVVHAMNAPFGGMLNMTTQPALAPSLLKVEKLSHGWKSVSELAKQPSARFVKAVITPVLNMRSTTSKVLTLGGNEGARMQPPNANAAQTKSASLVVEPKRTREPAGGSSQVPKSGPAISAEHLAKEPSGRLVAKVNPIPTFPPTILPVFMKGGNAPRNMQPPAPKAPHPNNGPFEGEPMGSTESAINLSLHKARIFIPTTKSAAEIPKERSALLVKEITYPGVITPKLLGKAGIEVFKLQPPTPNVSQRTPVSVTASLNRSESRIGNGLTELEIARMHRKETNIVPGMSPHAANIFREKTALALPTQHVTHERLAASNAPINQNANLNVVMEPVTSSLLLSLTKPVEANFTSHSAEAPFTKSELAKKAHKQPSVSLLLQPGSITDSQAFNFFAKSRLIPHVGTYPQHAWHHIHNVGASNERLMPLNFLHRLAEIAALDAAVRNNADQGHLFYPTLRTISHIGHPMQAQSMLLETMRPVRGSPQLTTLIEQARSRNFINRRFGAADAKHLLLRGNIFYNTEPLRERNGLENYALFSTRGIRPSQQPSSVRSTTHFGGTLGALPSHKFSGLSPYLLKSRKTIQLPYFIHEHIPILPHRVPALVKSSINVLKRVYEFFNIKKPDERKSYSSNLINAQLFSRLYAPLPYWHSATFEHFLSQKVESGHDMKTRQKLTPFVPKASRNVRGFFLPLRTLPIRVPRIPLGNIVSSRISRASHFLPKTDFVLRYAHRPTAFAMHWLPKTFENLLSEEVESGHDLVRRRNFSPSVQNSAEYVTDSISPLRTYFQYSSRISRKATTTSRTSGVSHSPGNMKLDARKLYSSNIPEIQPVLPLLYAMQSPWYPRTVEHVLSQEGKNRKGLIIKRIFFPFIKNNGNDMGAHTSPLSTHSEYIP